MGQAPIERVLARLKEPIRQPSGGWLAPCPAHSDQRRSLKVDVAPDGKVLLRCHDQDAACAQGVIVRALGLRLRDLFPAQQPRPRTRVPRPGQGPVAVRRPR